MRRSIVMAAAGCLLSASAQAEPVFPQASSVGLDPPPGMHVADGFLGFQAGKASIVIIELPKEAYAQINASRSLLSDKITGAKTDNLSIGKTPGFIVRGTQEADGTTYRKWAVVLDGGAETAMVTVQVPVQDTAVSDAAVETSLQSIVFRDRPGLTEQMAALPFVVADMEKFRPVLVVAGSALLLTDGPKDVDPSAEQPVVVVSTSLQRPPPAAQREGYALATLKSLKDITTTTIVSQRLFESGGAQWAEIEAKGTRTTLATPVSVSFFMRFNDSESLIVTATAKLAEQARYSDRFKRLALSVKPRG